MTPCHECGDDHQDPPNWFAEYQAAKAEITRLTKQQNTFAVEIERLTSQIELKNKLVSGSLDKFGAIGIELVAKDKEIERLAAQIARFEQLGELYARWNVDEMRAVVNDQARADHEEIERLTKAKLHELQNAVLKHEKPAPNALFWVLAVGDDGTFFAHDEHGNTRSQPADILNVINGLIDPCARCEYKDGNRCNEPSGGDKYRFDKRNFPKLPCDKFKPAPNAKEEK